MSRGSRAEEELTPLPVERGASWSGSCSPAPAQARPSRLWWARTIAAAPIPARCEGASAWTGQEVLVWGRACGLTPGPSPGRSRDATAGAAYDPTADRWRVLPPGPVEAGSVTTSVWTGVEWVLFNTVSPTGVFDPAGGRWRILPPVPRPFSSISAQWTGQEVLVLGTEILEKGPSTASGAAYRHWTAALDVGRGQWRALPPPPLELAATAVWDGRRLIAWDQNLNSVALDPAGGAGWKNLAGLPLDFTDGVWRYRPSRG